MKGERESYDDIVNQFLGRVPASIGEDAVRVAIDCQACAESLELVTQTSSTWRVLGGTDAH